MTRTDQILRLMALGLGLREAIEHTSCFGEAPVIDLRHYAYLLANEIFGEVFP